jgi:hypothetical protein
MNSNKRPRTKNALSHGLYASDLVLAWENEQDFLDLHQSIRDELNPEGVSEDLVVLDLARLHWVKRRLNIGSQLAYHGHPDAEAITDAGQNGWAGVREFLRGTVDDRDQLVDQIRAGAKAQAKVSLQILELIGRATARTLVAPPPSKSKSERPQQPSHARAASLLDDTLLDDELLKNLLHLADQVQAIGTTFFDPLKLVENYDLDQGFFGRAYRPEILERHLKIEAQIDSRVEKALTRLANLKEFKRIYAAKEVKGRRTDAVALHKKGG